MVTALVGYLPHAAGHHTGQAIRLAGTARFACFTMVVPTLLVLGDLGG